MSTATRWCESGKLPAIAEPFGTKITYKISAQTVDMLKVMEERKAKDLKIAKRDRRPHPEFISDWLQAMAKGTLNGKAYSQRTIDDYHRYIKRFFTGHAAVSQQALERELAAIPLDQFATREHYYKAILCFGRYLVHRDALDESFIRDIEKLYPKRHKPPKRFTVDETGIEKLLAACETTQERLILILLTHTGLRASEACALRWADIDFNQDFLVVRCGKGGKTRRVGLSGYLMSLLQKHLNESIREGTAGQSIPILLNRIGQAMDSSGLYQRLARIGIKAGVKVSPHALRRAFVTINAGKGRSLVHLQKACGHTSVRTTEDYCLTSELEVIEAMKTWD